MPDMQTALSTAISKMTTKEMTHVNNLLNQWADDEKTTMTDPTTPSRVTNNVSRRTFNFFKENPGCIKKDAVQNLTLQGLKPASTTSLITQFVKAGQFRKEGDRYYTVNNEYRSLPTTRMKNLQNKKVKPEKIAAAPHTVMAQELPKAKQNPQEIVKHMNVYQARELYDHLRCMFGS
jgi:hypothetical protein